MKNKRVAKISAKRLSRIITTREWLKAQSNLLQFYECLTVEQRKEIKDMFIKNSKIN